MKESIGSTQLFIIVITLVLLFAGIMTMTVKRSNAFAIKDSIISIIEDNGGLDTTSNSGVINDIVHILAEQSYRQKGKCPNAVNAVGYDRNGQIVSGNQDAAFCIIKKNGTNAAGTATKYYYTVELFYSLDLPIIKDTFNFKVTGETKALFE